MFPHLILLKNDINLKLIFLSSQYPVFFEFVSEFLISAHSWFLQWSHQVENAGFGASGCYEIGRFVRGPYSINRWDETRELNWWLSSCWKKKNDVAVSRFYHQTGEWRILTRSDWCLSSCATSLSISHMWPCLSPLFKCFSSPASLNPQVSPTPYINFPDFLHIANYFYEQKFTILSKCEIIWSRIMPHCFRFHAYEYEQEGWL